MLFLRQSNAHLLVNNKLWSFLDVKSQDQQTAAVFFSHIRGVFFSNFHCSVDINL